MTTKYTVIDGNKIFLKAIKKAGIEIPKNEQEFKSVISDVRKLLEAKK